MARRRRRRKLPSNMRLPRLHRRHPVATVAIPLLIVSVWIGRSQHSPARPQVGDDYTRYHDREFTVVRVVDGDTVDIDAPDGRKATTRIRLWGVDTPEVATAPRGEMYWGPEASDFAKKTLANRRVRLELVEGNTRGKYGRLLAYIRDDETGTMFNALLLSDGHAYADTRFAHPYREQFRRLEREARDRGSGLWRAVTTDQMPRWRQRGEHP